MDEGFLKDGPLELVWLAGSGQLNNTVKGRKSKLYRRVAAISIVDLCAGVKAVVDVPYQQRTLGLKKMSMLMYGLAVLSEMKIDKLQKLVDALFHKYTTINLGLPAAISVTVTANKAKRNYTVKEKTRDGSLDCEAQNLTITFGQTDWPGYLDNDDPLDIRHCRGGLVPTVSPIMAEDQVEEIEDRPTNGRRQRRDSRDLIQPLRRVTDASILAALQNLALHLRPLAHTMIEADLPQLPAVDNEGMEFGDFGPFQNEPDMLGDLQFRGSNVELDDEYFRHRRLAAEMSPPRTTGIPKIPPKPRRSGLLPIGQEDEGSFELDSIERTEVSAHVRGRRRGRRLIFDEPESTVISDAEMRRQCEPIPMSDMMVQSIRRKKKPVRVRIGMEIFERHRTKPTKQEIWEIQFRRMKGLDFLSSAGRPIPSHELREMIDSLPNPIVYDSQLPESQIAAENVRQVRQARLYFSALAAGRPAIGGRTEPKSLGPPPADGENVPITSANAENGGLDMIPEELENIPPEIVYPEPNQMEFAGFNQRDVSQSPLLTQERNSFQRLVPPGSSRTAACHMFASLLRMQKDKRITMEQVESYGIIYIDNKT